MVDLLLWTIFTSYGVSAELFVPNEVRKLSVKYLTQEKHVLASIKRQSNWLSLIEAAKKGKCLDGRTTHPIFGMLGGTGGALLRLIQAFIFSLPRDQRDEAFAKILASFGRVLDLFRGLASLCTHTDDHAQIKSEPTGCGYLKKYRDESNDFGFAGGAEIVPLLVNSRVDADEYEVLRGKHQEQGALVIVSEHPGGLVPMVQPSVDGQQFFIYHPQVEEALYRLVEPKLLALLTEITGRRVHPAEFRENLKKLTQQHVLATLKKLAPGKPVYEVVVRNEQDLEVKETLAA